MTFAGVNRRADDGEYKYPLDNRDQHQYTSDDEQRDEEIGSQDDKVEQKESRKKEYEEEEEVHNDTEIHGYKQRDMNVKKVSLAHHTNVNEKTHNQANEEHNLQQRSGQKQTEYHAPSSTSSSDDEYSGDQEEKGKEETKAVSPSRRLPPKTPSLDLSLVHPISKDTRAMRAEEKFLLRQRSQSSSGKALRGPSINASGSLAAPRGRSGKDGGAWDGNDSGSDRRSGRGQGVSRKRKDRVTKRKSSVRGVSARQRYNEDDGDDAVFFADCDIDDEGEEEEKRVRGVERLPPVVPRKKKSSKSKKTHKSKKKKKKVTSHVKRKQTSSSSEAHGMGAKSKSMGDMATQRDDTKNKDQYGGLRKNDIEAALNFRRRQDQRFLGKGADVMAIDEIMDALNESRPSMIALIDKQTKDHIKKQVEVRYIYIIKKEKR